MAIQDQLFDTITIKQIVEAIIFASSKPVSAEDLIHVLMNTDSNAILEVDDLRTIINHLNDDYQTQGRAFRIQKTGGGYTFYTLTDFHKWLQHIQHENLSRKITQSALETLAIIAYKQPITKPVIDAIRGVDSGYMAKQLLEKGLIEVSGRADSPGRPLLYRTTNVFLKHFNLNALNELPKPREIDEILKDDDMAEHRQIMLELKSELYDQFNKSDQGESQTSNNE